MTWGTNVPVPENGESLLGVPMGTPLAWSALARCSFGSGKFSVVENPLLGSVILPWAISADLGPRPMRVMPQSVRC
jgi:hypothetical protein